MSIFVAKKLSIHYHCRINLAEVAELAYAQVSEACASRLEGSNPSFRTIFTGGGVPPAVKAVPYEELLA